MIFYSYWMWNKFCIRIHSQSPSKSGIFLKTEIYLLYCIVSLEWYSIYSRILYEYNVYLEYSVWPWPLLRALPLLPDHWSLTPHPSSLYSYPSPLIPLLLYLARHPSTLISQPSSLYSYSSSLYSYPSPRIPILLCLTPDPSNLIPHPSSLYIYPSFLLSRPVSLIPHPTSVIAHSSSHIPHPISLIPHNFSLSLIPYLSFLIP